MDLLEQHQDLIQKRLFQYTDLALGSRKVSRLYYDCTNFYTEKESEDCDVKGKDAQWHKEHTLRKYGFSKEHRPNPIVQMGLFMDGDGIPLGFCINPGNTNEQVTIRPLEKQLIKNFSDTDIIVCTDAGLASEDMRRFNNITEEDTLSQFGLRGKRHYICVQSIKKLKEIHKEWALDTKGWCYQRREQNLTETVRNFDLESINDANRHLFADVIFFKERTTAENGLDQRLIATYSLKYRDYSENLRANKVNEDSRYDGFYCLATNLFKEECSVREIAAIQDRRWEIEECFRIMKTELRSRPFYHNKDSRIKAHFLTCFTALLLIRGLERKVAEHCTDNARYPDGKYTVSEILRALRSLNLISIAEGKAYIPDYRNSELISDLLDIFELNKFRNQIVMKDELKKILKKIKTSPEMILDKDTD